MSDEIKARISFLREEILRHNHLYYELSDPEIADTDYDDLYRELLHLEAQHPDLDSTDSPTKMVGGKLISKMASVKHHVAVNSLDKAYSSESVTDFFINAKSRVKYYSREEFSAGYIVEPKYDGLTLVLHYKDGVLYRALTRGDGKYGNDVTHNAKVIASIPKTLPFEIQNLFVRGEAVITHQEFDRINEEQKKAGKPEFKNPRNLVSGSIQQLDSNITKTRNILFIPYEITEEFDPHRAGITLYIYNKGKYTPYTITNQEQTVKLFAKLGFAANLEYQKFENLDSLYKACVTPEFYEKIRNLAYDVDGFVIKLNSIKLRHELGVGTSFPYWQLAFKMPQTKHKTLLKDVEWGIGKTGAITPVAVFKTIRMDGSDVSRATLHNVSELKRLGLKINHVVVVEKAGGVIPAIIHAMDEMPYTNYYQEIPIIDHCPACFGGVVLKDGTLYCANPESCIGTFNKRLLYFVGKKGLDIDGFGDKLCTALCKAGVSSFADVFRLTVERLKPIIGGKTAEKIVEQIKAKRSVSLEKLIAVLQIPNIGQTSSKQLADHFKTLDAVKAASQEDISKIDNFGPVLVKSVWAYFRNAQNMEELEDILSYLSIKEEPQSTTGKLSGSFCITGTLSMPRERFESLIKANGGTISNSVTKKLNYLLVGEDAGSKLTKAKDLGIKILSESEFEEMLK